jgi:hypothetical protein
MPNSTLITYQDQSVFDLYFKCSNNKEKKTGFPITTLGNDPREIHPYGVDFQGL